MATPYRFAVFFISRRKWSEMSECHNGDLLSRTTASYEMCNLARKWCLQNNPHTLRVRFKMDMVFYIFKVSHNHALFRFSLSSESDNPCWVLCWKNASQQQYTLELGRSCAQLQPSLWFSWSFYHQQPWPSFCSLLFNYQMNSSLYLSLFLMLKTQW